MALKAVCLAIFLGTLGFTSVPATTFYCDPAKGTMDGDGSAEKPWKTIEDVIAAGKIQVCDKSGKPTNPTAPVKPGDTILLRSGWHGTIKIDSGYNDQVITIAADAGHAPQVASVEIGEGRKWTIKGLTVSPANAPAPIDKVANLVLVAERGGEDSADIVIEDCFVYTVLDSAPWTARDWIDKASNGITLGRHGKGHVARNNYVLNTRFAINLCTVGALAEGNVVCNFSGDGMRITRDGEIAQHNVIKNNFVGDADGDKNHDDGIQVFLFNVGTGTVRNVTIRSNIVINREADTLPFPNPMQGIGCFDGPLVDFTVEKNVVLVNHWHGVSLYDAQNCTISNNACYSRWKDELKPWVMVGGKVSKGNTVKNNLAHTFDLKADGDIKADNNKRISEAVFNQRMAELAAEIDKKFGKLHPVAKRPRLGAAPHK